MSEQTEQENASRLSFLQVGFTRLEAAFKAIHTMLRDRIDGVERALSNRIAALESADLGYSRMHTGGGGGVTAHPFKVINATSGEDPAVRVVFGTVNSLVPKIDGIPMDELVGDPPAPITIDIPADGVIYLHAVYFGEGIEMPYDAEVVFATELPESDDTGARYLLATVHLNGEGTAIASINQAVTHSLFVQRVKCGITIASYYWNAV